MQVKAIEINFINTVLENYYSNKINERTQYIYCKYTHEINDDKRTYVI